MPGQETVCSCIFKVFVGGGKRSRLGRWERENAPVARPGCRSRQSCGYKSVVALGVDERVGVAVGGRGLRRPVTGEKKRGTVGELR